MPIKFPARGIHDNKLTPKSLYDIITKELKFTDICIDKNKFDATVQIWPNHSYCNPPFSIKKPFISKAIKSNKIGNEVLLYLPFDPTVSWFKELYQQNALIMIFMKRMAHTRFPHALYHLKNYNEPKVILIQNEHDILKFLR